MGKNLFNPWSEGLPSAPQGRFHIVLGSSVCVGTVSDNSCQRDCASFVFKKHKLPGDSFAGKISKVQDFRYVFLFAADVWDVFGLGNK